MIIYDKSTQKDINTDMKLSRFAHICVTNFKILSNKTRKDTKIKLEKAFITL